MASDKAALRFVSWLRRGLATQITMPDSSPELNPPPPIPARATFKAEIGFNDDTGLVAATDVGLLGPGDIVDFDAHAIVRSWPPAGTHDAEPNYFPLVEMDQADLPWRYTPTRAAVASQRLRPWLCLLVLREDEIAALDGPDDKRRLAQVTIKAGTPMPRVEEAWAWAHVQVSGDDGTPIEKIVREQPERSVARLLCPRQLVAKTRYLAVVVPTFEIGRRAGLRLPVAPVPNVPGNPGVKALTPAWTPVSGKITSLLELPVYHRWSFSTGVGGDFESLVRALKTHELPPDGGTRPLDVSQPGSQLPAAASAPLPLGGALRPVDSGSSPWLPAERQAFVKAIAGLLNLPAELRANRSEVPAEKKDPVVAPPLYGTWHARRDKLATSPSDAWFHQLNGDPRHRVTAALGTQVVQTRQQELMASAWEQVGAIREINDRLRKAQLGRSLAERLYRRFIVDLDLDTTLLFTSGLHARVLHLGSTVGALIRQSPLGAGLVSGGFRRLVRTRGSLGRRQARFDKLPGETLVKINAGQFPALPRKPPAPSNLPTHKWLEELSKQKWKGLPSAAQVLGAPQRPNVTVRDPSYPAYGLVDPEPGTGGKDSPSLVRFREAAVAMAGRQNAPMPGELLPKLDLVGIRATLVAALDPRVTIPAWLGPRVVAPGWQPLDLLEPIMAAPEFPQPMYKPLAELSQEWILPGLAAVPANSVSLAETNKDFIEAYMVGLNHEMARELLWSEYPTDQRGSYFRQFWDPRGLPPLATPDGRKDIQPVHGWKANDKLGKHSVRPSAKDSDLVLLVRAEVLRRYPGTLVYAQNAFKPAANKPRQLGEIRMNPLFSGKLRPDVAFFGFDLTSQDAIGGLDDEGEDHGEGWFFVFEEQPGEPRFGLDATKGSTFSSWDDLAWPHLIMPAQHYIDIAGTSPPTPTATPPAPAPPSWKNASGAEHAHITLQRQVRVAVHASELLKKK